MDFKERFKGKISTMSKQGISAVPKLGYTPTDPNGPAADVKASPKKIFQSPAILSNKPSFSSLKSFPQDKPSGAKASIRANPKSHLDSSLNAVLSPNFVSKGGEEPSDILKRVNSQNQVETLKGALFSSIINKSRSPSNTNEYELFKGPIKPRQLEQREAVSNPFPDKKLSNGDFYYVGLSKVRPKELGAQQDRGNILVNNSTNIIRQSVEPDSHYLEKHQPTLASPGGQRVIQRPSPLNHAENPFLNLKLYEQGMTPAHLYGPPVKLMSGYKPNKESTSETLSIQSKQTDNSTSGYRPYTLKEYQESVKTNTYKLGGLGPNVMTDEWYKRKQKLDKMAEFSEHVKAMNAERYMERLEGSQETEDAPRKGSKDASKRDRALEFAKNIGKNYPKHVEQLRSAHDEPPERAESLTMPNQEDQIDILERERRKYLQQLEAIRMK